MALTVMGGIPGKLIGVVTGMPGIDGTAEAAGNAGGGTEGDEWYGMDGCCPDIGEIMGGKLVWPSTPIIPWGIAFIMGTVGIAPILRGLGSGIGA